MATSAEEGETCEVQADDEEEKRQSPQQESSQEEGASAKTPQDQDEVDSLAGEEDTNPPKDNIPASDLQTAAEIAQGPISDGITQNADDPPDNDENPSILRDAPSPTTTPRVNAPLMQSRTTVAAKGEADDEISRSHSLEEDSIDGTTPSSGRNSRGSDGLERRSSIVSKTEIVTSPGGTKTVKVGLKGQPAVPQQQEPAPMWNPHDDDPVFPGGTVPSVEADEDEAALAAALAADMEREMELEERKHKSTASIPKSMPRKGPDAKRKSPEWSEHEVLHDSGPTGTDPLAEKDRQIESLQAQLMDALRGEVGVVDGLDAGVAGPDKRDAKIVALAKKNRSLNLALERQKTRIAQLEAEASETRKVQARGQAKSKIRREIAQNQSNSEEEALSQQRLREARESAHQEYAERLADVEHRCDQMRQKCLRATNEAKRLKRVLTREVGDGPQLEKVLEEVASGSTIDEENSGWRGRAQKIVLLKDKLKRAQAQLAHLHQQQQHEHQAHDPELTGSFVAGSPMGFGAAGSGISSSVAFGREDDVDARAARDIRTIEQERRHAMEKLAHEYEHVESSLAEAKRTIHAVRARGKVLEGENKRFKEQLKVLLKKTSNDDTLVDALRRELDRVKRELNSCRESSRAREESSRTNVEFEELKQHAMNQAAQIERQGQLLVKMRTEMERVKATASRDIVQKAHEELDNQGHAVNSKLLKVENDRLGELVDLFKQKLERAVVDREAALGKCKKLERAKVELERRLGNIHAGGRKRQPMADQLSELRDQLALQVEETRVARASASQAISQKNEEIRILREMGVQVKEAYERAIEDMKVQVQQTALEAQRRIQSSDCHVDEALLSQLTKDNEYLRGELFDMRDRKLSPTRSSPTFRAQQHSHHQQLKRIAYTCCHGIEAWAQELKQCLDELFVVHLLQRKT
ncbi:Coiled-coil domain-containing protein 13 [Hondaea fermentalgiana]|uniref:Coiled-coil domain-containing protein 13 n=1 Tax=Hondaea fermentalgiana TaxID=2315210 RepID=A0A2R5GQR4_9STRA|nr:Coiled-coil domain-containing protein 13 [Hondaea fermentalgiana]|eukprot:GBG32945.1 Coiled-coil domain-containing protein 13 [Hondaea fermentalgiana]